LNKIATKENLSRRGLQLAETSCVLCRFEEENTTHLFLKCKIANMVWNFCNKWVGISSVQHNQLNMHFQHFSLMALNKKKIKYGKAYGYQLFEIFGTIEIRLCLNKGKWIQRKYLLWHN